MQYVHIRPYIIYTYLLYTALMHLPRHFVPMLYTTIQNKHLLYKSLYSLPEYAGVAEVLKMVPPVVLYAWEETPSAREPVQVASTSAGTYIQYM